MTDVPDSAASTVSATGLVAWFEELSRADVPRVGGKGANLGELTRAGLPVPPGFVITAQAYLQAMDAAGVRSAMQTAAAEVDVDSPEALASAAARLQETVHSAGVPDLLRHVVLDAYHRLGAETRVAVRSSATAEDSASTSFAGMNETFTNVSGDDELLERVVDCWASLFGPRVVAYRATHRLAEEPAIAVVVQQMVDSDTSGVMFTADPATGDRSTMVIEASYGLGEVVVGGQVAPDTYVVAKDGPRLRQVHVGSKAEKIVRGPDGHDLRLPVPPEEQGRRVLDDETVLALAHMAMAIEQHYGTPQDVEFARAGGQTWIV
jgi:pyruvate,water dikinase